MREEKTSRPPHCPLSLLGRESSAWGVIAAGSELSRLRDKSLSLNLFKTALVTHPWYFVVRRGRCLRYP
jgi:hypothetical protein